MEGRFRKGRRKVEGGREREREKEGKRKGGKGRDINISNPLFHTYRKYYHLYTIIESYIYTHTHTHTHTQHMHIHIHMISSYIALTNIPFIKKKINK